MNIAFNLKMQSLLDVSMNEIRCVLDVCNTFDLHEKKLFYCV